jgi:hypothetical protein
LRLEGLSKLKKKIHLIGTQSRDLAACSILPQPTTLPRAPVHVEERIKVMVINLEKIETVLGKASSNLTDRPTDQSRIDS